MDTWLKFLGWFLTEGSIANKGHTIAIAQQNRENIREVTSIFNTMKLRSCYTGGRISAYSTQIAEYCRRFGHAPHKYIPDYVKQLCPRQLKILIETMLKGDGGKNGVFYTSSKRLADDFQEIAIKSGYGTSMNVRPINRKVRIKGREVKSQHPKYEVTLARKSLTPQVCVSPEIVYYKGMIYDVTVPNHVILVRRKGKVIWCGNSRDNENLAWARKTSPIDDILMITGDSVDLDCSWDTVKVSDLTYNKMNEYEVALTCDSFYVNQMDRFKSIEKIIDNFWDRLAWKLPICVIVREASSFIYSRIKQGARQQEAKADFIYWQREMRHFGYTLFIDTIRWTSVDKEMRDLADYLIIKKLGPQGLPYDIKWLYKFVNPLAMAALPPQFFLLLTESAAIGFGMSQLPVFHKEEGVNLLAELDIKITMGEMLEEGSLRRVGDLEHAEIIREYNELKSIRKVQKKIRRSTQTIHRHIREHNRNVLHSGTCPKCKRTKSDLVDVELFIE